MRVGVLLSGRGSNLQALLDANGLEYVRLHRAIRRGRGALRKAVAGLE